jgi:hypothetical protein
VAAVTLVPPPPQPRILSLVGPQGPVLVNSTNTLTVVAQDPDGGQLLYGWSASAGTFSGQGATTVWTAPATGGVVDLQISITGQAGGVIVGQLKATVTPSVFQANLPVGLRAPRRVATAPTGEMAVADGEGQLWLLTKLGGLRAKPAITDGVVAVAGAPGAFYASTTDGSILKLDVATGRIVARYKLGMSRGPTGLAWDEARGLLWMAHRAAGVVQAIRADGSSAVTITNAGGVELHNAYDVAVDASTGTVWVTQDGNVDGALVHAFQGDGAFVRSIVASGQIYRAGGLAAAGGKVYVSDAFAGQVQVVSETGALMGAVGSFGNEAGQLRQPAGLTFMANGDLLVANLDAGRLDRFGTGALPVACPGDSDCDGMSDEAELAAGLDPYDPSDALADADHDGLSNTEELALGTNPFERDTDGDGVSDRDELLAGFDPLDASDHAASLVASAPALSAPGLIRVTGLAAGAGACTTAWKQVEGPAVSLAGATTASPSFVARAAGTYVLEGVATCGKSGSLVASAPARVSVAVSNQAPLADAGRLQVVAPGDLLELSAARSSDANGDALTYAWEQVAGPAAAATQKDAKLVVRPLAPGYQAFKVAARDARGAVGEAEVPVIMVEPPSLIPTAMAVSTVLVGQVGQPVQLEVVSPEGTAFSWEQVSGPQASGLDPTLAAPTFIPTAAGRHVFRVTAWNGELRSAPETVQVFVADGSSSLPGARATAPAQGAVNVALTLDGSASAASAGGGLSYRWRQVSGPAAGLTYGDRASASLVPFAAGYHEFELTVVENGAVGVPVRVGLDVLAAGKALPVAAAKAPVTALVGELVRLDGSASVGAARWRWTQVAGPWVALKSTQASPTFVPVAAGQYVFELEVDDGSARSRPQQVSVLVTGQGN